MVRVSSLLVLTLTIAGCSAETTDDARVEPVMTSAPASEEEAARKPRVRCECVNHVGTWTGSYSSNEAACADAATYCRSTLSNPFLSMCGFVGGDGWAFTCANPPMQ